MPISIGHNILASTLTLRESLTLAPPTMPPVRSTTVPLNSSCNFLVKRLLTSSPAAVRHASRTKPAPCRSMMAETAPKPKIIKQQTQNQPEHAPKPKRRRPTFFEEFT